MSSENNTTVPQEGNTTNFARFVKPTLDTIDFAKGIPVNVLSSPENVKVFNNSVQIKSGALNMVIPIVDAAAGKKEWDEAIARGAGDTIQDYLVATLAAAGYAAFFGTNPVGWGAVGVGFVSLGVTWITSYYDSSLGVFLEKQLVDMKSGAHFKLTTLVLDGKVINWDNHATVPDKLVIEDFENKILFAYDKPSKTSTIKTNNLETQKKAIEIFTKIDDIKSVTLNSHTYDIRNLSNLEIRNAIDKIPKASFLLSNILIRTGEELDLGSKGIYKVKSGDTLSTIAQRNGMVTKELLKLNTWLVDEGRVKFLKNKVLVESNILELNEIDHVLVGDRNAENILIDANGGDDTLVGGNKKDILKGGEGFDTYYAGDKDIITDSDGKGEVYFDKTKLTGGTYDKEKKVYVSDDKNKAWGFGLKCA